jgi:hypothetical protein
MPQQLPSTSLPVHCLLNHCIIQHRTSSHTLYTVSLHAYCLLFLWYISYPLPLSPAIYYVISAVLQCLPPHFKCKYVNGTSNPSGWRFSFLWDVNAALLQLLVGQTISSTPFTFVVSRLVHKSRCCSTPCHSGNCEREREDCQLNKKLLIFSLTLSILVIERERLTSASII